jgi:arabinofuranan 3-O-arabinosyltransferase
VINAGERLPVGSNSSGRLSRTLAIFTPKWLQAYGYTIVVFYAAALGVSFKAGSWLLDSGGVPVLSDFTNAWIAGIQALRGNTAALYDAAEFIKLQAAVVGPSDVIYPNWPYPPTFFLILAPLALLPYIYAFVAWTALTLSGCIVVVHLIVRRASAIAVLLASPFTVWNLAAGQNGFLTASLLGASLLFLERRPVLAGVLVGCLTYKPQFGILLPLALVAASQWRAFASAAATAALLVGASILAFGIAAWEVVPRELMAQTRDYLVADPQSSAVLSGWGRIHTVYGLVRHLDGGAIPAWLAQGVTTLGVAAIVWFVWRSRVRYSLKAAALSAGVLVATPYALAYDMAIIAIPTAFLARDQIVSGLLRGEQTILIALFAASLAVLVSKSFPTTPIGPVVVITLLSLILRRALIMPSTAVPDYGFGVDPNNTAQLSFSSS